MIFLIVWLVFGFLSVGILFDNAQTYRDHDAKSRYWHNFIASYTLGFMWGPVALVYEFFMTTNMRFRWW